MLRSEECRIRQGGSHGHAASWRNVRPITITVNVGSGTAAQTIERELRSLDRTPEAARSIEELEQVVADIRQALGSVRS